MSLLNFQWMDCLPIIENKFLHFLNVDRSFWLTIQSTKRHLRSDCFIYIYTICCGCTILVLWTQFIPCLFIMGQLVPNLYFVPLCNWYGICSHILIGHETTEVARLHVIVVEHRTQQYSNQCRMLVHVISGVWTRVTCYDKHKFLYNPESSRVEAKENVLYSKFKYFYIFILCNIWLASTDDKIVPGSGITMVDNTMNHPGHML